MKIPKNTIDLVKTFEGFRSKPYLCPANVPTIGYGSTAYPDGKKVSLQDVSITKEQAVDFMTAELSVSMSRTIKLCPILLTIDESKLGAIVDFVYNLGSGRLQQSTLRRKINAQQWEDVPKELNKWVYGGGRKLPGLVKRRRAESLFF